MIDIHSHVVWGVDDGARDMDESIAMLQLASRRGTTCIVATPHLNARYAYDAELVEQRIGDLAERIGGVPSIHRGCEFHLNFDNIEHLLEHPSTYTISGKQYLLLECPDFHIGSYAAPVLQRLLDAGLIPIVAHPERNPVLRKDLKQVEKWVELGCLMQLTALSITGGFGNSAKSASMRMLEEGLAHLVASDAHDLEQRGPWLDEAYSAVQSRFGDDAAEILFQENPLAVVEGAGLLAGRLTPRRPAPRWFEFWKSSAPPD